MSRSHTFSLASTRATLRLPAWAAALERIPKFTTIRARGLSQRRVMEHAGMKSLFRPRPWLVLAIIPLLIATAWAGRQKLRAWTRESLIRQHLREIAMLPESQAAMRVLLLAQDEEAELEVIVATTADPRPAVAAASNAALVQLVERWRQLPASESSQPVAALASLIAEQSPQLPLERRAFFQALAYQLLLWPVDGRKADAAQLVTDCEAVLRVPLPDADELRVAAAASTLPSLPATLPSSPPEDAPVAPPAPLPIPAAAAALQPSPLPNDPASQQPSPLVDANREAPLEPKRFLPPKAIRISDD
jgi:hypothetical protein